MSDAPVARLNALVNAADGIPYDRLVHFARPLFEAYDVEIARADAAAHGGADEAPDDLVLVLDTARLLWSYFALGTDGATDHAPDLEAALLPEGGREDDHAAFLVLLGELEERFQDHLESAATAPDFGAVLAAYLVAYPSDDPHATAAEAIAAFARPLLDATDVTDLDELDRQMDLAHLLWDAAHAPDAGTRAALLDDARNTYGLANPAAVLRDLLSAAR